MFLKHSWYLFEIFRPTHFSLIWRRRIYFEVVLKNNNIIIAMFHNYRYVLMQNTTFCRIVYSVKIYMR